MDEKTQERFWSKVEKHGPDECWVWKAASCRDGYGQFWLNRRYERVHRISYRLHKGDIPNGLLVRHRCDNPPCVNPAHLEAGTHADNMADMVARNRTGKTRTGSRHRKKRTVFGNAKLTEPSVRAIRQDDRSHREVAASFGISTSQVGRIKNRENWTHVK